MSMKKKALMAASYVMVAALAVGGTVAFLTDEEHDVNVMTLGNVDIIQHEYQRQVGEDGSYATENIDDQQSYVLEDFTQLKPLLPIVGDPNEPGDSPAYAGWDETTVRMTQVGSYGGMQVFAGKNAQDKFVTVENTGLNDAYIRTIVAIEVGSTDGALIGTSYHQTWTKNEVGIAQIEGKNYYLTEYIYAGGKLNDGSWRHENGILPAGDTSYPNLSQVYLKSVATNEDVEAIDGNNNGKLDILVVSQAVQAEGFDNAEAALNAGFGDITTSTHPWSDVTVTSPVVYTKGEHTISGDVTVGAGENADPVEASGANTVVNIIGGTYNSVDPDCAVWAHDGATINIYGGEYTCGACEDVTNHHSDLIYAGSKTDGTTGYINIYGGTFSAPVAGDWLLNAADNLGVITVYGGTFKNFDPSDNVAEGPNTSFVADGYKVVEEKDGEDIWYTVVKAD